MDTGLGEVVNGWQMVAETLMQAWEWEARNITSGKHRKWYAWQPPALSDSLVHYLAMEEKLAPGEWHYCGSGKLLYRGRPCKWVNKPETNEKGTQDDE